MDPIEKAIRTGFTRGDPADPTFREKVYRSAFAALDRALQANPETTVERAIARRRELQNKVKEIEAGFLAPPVALEPEAQGFGTAPSVAVGPERRDSVEPSLDPGDFSATGAVPQGGPEGTVAPDPDAHRAKRGGRPLRTLLALAAVLAALAVGGWLLLGRGFLPAGHPDGTPPLTVEDILAGEETGAGPLSASTDTREWIRVFSPDDPSTVAVPAGGDASVETADGIPFLRVRSGAKGEAVRFDVGQGVLEKLAGRKAVFDIAARAEEGADTQVSVGCDFGGFGACGRKRYDVTGAGRAELLFEVEFPDGRPSAGGAIVLEPDVAAGVKALDVYEIRVSPSD